ncbi:hypothetical protein SAZ10_32555 [Mesorhizobium sp. BAC0120]|uniref:hypothetical protein n=1 Tax=Mesorhizobium sp. BAC0120 TaxID=3090670 RepID=UPI00298C47F1|nr:hypothetical protein [Mesorhizobium sp. BAC0120]MDW6026503.1 hypothetical protein [Mesorhizobium sp. BAC0120]
MLKMLILVCSVNVSPADCQQETALDIIQGPQVASVFECGMASQAMAAQTSILRHGSDEYMKVKCSRLKVADAAAKDAKLSPATLGQR